MSHLEVGISQILEGSKLVRKIIDKKKLRKTSLTEFRHQMRSGGLLLSLICPPSVIVSCFSSSYVIILPEIALLGVLKRVCQIDGPTDAHTVLCGDGCKNIEGCGVARRNNHRQ